MKKFTYSILTEFDLFWMWLFYLFFISKSNFKSAQILDELIHSFKTKTS